MAINGYMQDDEERKAQAAAEPPQAQPRESAQSAVSLPRKQTASTTQKMHTAASGALGKTAGNAIKAQAEQETDAREDEQRQAAQQAYAAQLGTAMDTVQTKVVRDYTQDPLATATPEQKTAWAEDEQARAEGRTPSMAQGKPDWGYNEITVDFKSIPDKDTAIYFATSLRGDDERARFLDDYCDYTGEDPEALLEYGEKLLDDKLFSSPVSNGARSRAYMTDLSSMGMIGFDGQAINVNSANPATVVRGIRSIADKDDREQAAKTYIALTQTPGSRFYGQTVNEDELTTFIDSANLTESDYKKQADGYHVLFYGDSEHAQADADAYLAKRAEIEGSDYTPYAQQQLIGALDRAYRTTTGAQGLPGEQAENGHQTGTKTAETATDEDRARYVDWLMGVERNAAQSDASAEAAQNTQETAQSTQEAAQDAQGEQAAEPAAEVYGPEVPEQSREQVAWAAARAAGMTPEQYIVSRGGMSFEQWLTSGGMEQVMAQDAPRVANTPEEAMEALLAGQYDAIEGEGKDQLDAWLSGSTLAQTVIGTMGTDKPTSSRMVEDIGDDTVYLQHLGVTGYKLISAVRSDSFPQELRGMAYSKMVEWCVRAEQMERDGTLGMPEGASSRTPLVERLLQTDEQAMNELNAIYASRDDIISDRQAAREEAQQASDAALADAREAFLGGYASEEQIELIAQNAGGTWIDDDESYWDWSNNALAYFRGEDSAFAQSTVYRSLDAQGVTDKGDYETALRNNMMTLVEEDAHAAAYVGMSLDEYYERMGGMTTDTLAERAASRIAQQGAQITPDEQEAMSQTWGEGVGMGTSVGMGLVTGGEQWFADFGDSLYAGLSQARVWENQARMQLKYQDQYGAYGRTQYRKDLQTLIDSGTLEPTYAQALSTALVTAADPYQIGIDPSSFLTVIPKTVSEVRRDIDANYDFMRTNATEDEFKWFQRSAGVAYNTTSAAVAAATTFLTGGHSTLGFMTGYSVTGYGNHFKDYLGKGYSIESASALAMINTGTDIAANLATFQGTLGRMTGGSTLLSSTKARIAVNPAGFSRGWTALKSFAGSFAKGQLDEVVLDEIKENIGSNWTENTFGELFRRVDAGEELTFSDMLKFSLSMIDPVNLGVVDAAGTVAENAVENFIGSALFSLAGATGSAFGTVKGVKAAQDLMSGKRTDVGNVLLEVSRTLGDENACALIDEYARNQRKAEAVAQEIISGKDDTGNAEAAAKAKAQADEAQAQAESAQAAADNATAQFHEAADAVMSGDLSRQKEMSASRVRAGENQKTANEMRAVAQRRGQEASEALSKRLEYARAKTEQAMASEDAVAREAIQRNRQARAAGIEGEIARIEKTIVDTLNAIANEPQGTRKYNSGHRRVLLAYAEMQHVQNMANIAQESERVGAWIQGEDAAEYETLVRMTEEIERQVYEATKGIAGKRGASDSELDNARSAAREIDRQRDTFVRNARERLGSNTSIESTLSPIDAELAKLDERQDALDAEASELEGMAAQMNEMGIYGENEEAYTARVDDLAQRQEDVAVERGAMNAWAIDEINAEIRRLNDEAGELYERIAQAEEQGIFEENREAFKEQADALRANVNALQARMERYDEASGAAFDDAQETAHETEAEPEQDIGEALERMDEANEQIAQLEDQREQIQDPEGYAARAQAEAELAEQERKARMEEERAVLREHRQEELASLNSALNSVRGKNAKRIYLDEQQIGEILYSTGLESITAVNRKYRTKFRVNRKNSDTSLDGKIFTDIAYELGMANADEITHPEGELLKLLDRRDELEAELANDAEGVQAAIGDTSAEAYLPEEVTLGMSDPVTQWAASLLKQHTGLDLVVMRLPNHVRGYYDRANGRLVISSTIGTGEAMRRVIYHELGHYIEGTQGYEAYKKAALDALYDGNKDAMARDKQDVIDQYAEMGFRLSDADAEKELVQAGTERIMEELTGNSRLGTETYIRETLGAKRGFAIRLHDMLSRFLARRRARRAGAEALRRYDMLETARKELNSAIRQAGTWTPGKGGADATMGYTESRYVMRNPTMDGEQTVFRDRDGNAVLPQDVQYAVGRRQFGTRTAQELDTIDDQIKELLRGDASNYDPVSMRSRADEANGLIDDRGLDAVIQGLLDSEKTKGNWDAQEQANAAVALVRASHAGNATQTAMIGLAYLRQGTTAGQALQIRKLIKKLSPEGAMAEVVRSAEDYNRKKGVGAGYVPVGTQAPGRRTTRTTTEDGGTIRPMPEIIERVYSTAEAIQRRIDAMPAGTNRSNRWGLPLDNGKMELIRQYGLQNESLPGYTYSNATLKQRMLAAIMATPDNVRGDGLLTLCQQLEAMRQGLAVVTEADLNYINGQMSTMLYAEGTELEGEPQTDEGRIAMARAYNAQANTIPESRSGKLNALGFANMLSSPKTWSKNIGSNVLIRPLELTSEAVAGFIERKLVEPRTGTRTTAAPTIAEQRAGMRALASEAAHTLTDYFISHVDTGHGSRMDINRNNRTFNNEYLQAYKNLVDFFVQFGDRPFFEQCKSEELAVIRRLGMKTNEVRVIDGREVTVLRDMTEAEMDAEATRRATERVFQEDNAIVNAIIKFKREHPALDFVVTSVIPFVKTPANVGARMFQYSPAGLAYSLIKTGLVDSKRAGGTRFDQRKFVMNVGRGLTGTGMMIAGYILASSGAIQPGRGEEENKRRAGIEKTRGTSYNPHIKLGDYEIELDFAQPASGPLYIGAQIAWDMMEHEDAEWWEKAGIIALDNALVTGDQLFENSFLSGVSEMFRGYDGVAGVASNIAQNVAENNASRMTPSAIRMLAKLTDPYVRDYNSQNPLRQFVNQQIVQNWPMLRETLPIKKDITGDDMVQSSAFHWMREQENAALNMLNFAVTPFTVNAPKMDETLDELMDLSYRTGETSFLPGYLVASSKYEVTINKTTAKKMELGEDAITYDLTDEEKRQFNQVYANALFNGGTRIAAGRELGTETKIDGLRVFMNSEAYAGMDDNARMEAIEDMKYEAKLIAYQWIYDQRKGGEQ